MTRELIVRPTAEAEMAAARDWYDARSPGLGADFLLSVDAVLQAVARNPFRFPVIYKNVRRALTRRFPYQIFYIVEDVRILVLAVFHAKRNPTTWQDRA